MPLPSERFRVNVAVRARGKASRFHTQDLPKLMPVCNMAAACLSGLIQSYGILFAGP